ncbi:MAG: YrhA family protein [Rikenellaceae bacterium]
MEKIKDIIGRLNQEYAQLYPPASDVDIERVNNYLLELEIGELPPSLVAFLKICDGLEYNGLIIYGTHDDDIVRHNEDKHDYYEEFSHLLFFGSIDDDIYTYNATTQMFESRDINGMECWDEYDSFDTFFRGEMMQWLT